MRSEEAKKQMSITELGDQSGGIKEAGDICRVQVMQAHVDEVHLFTLACVVQYHTNSVKRKEHCVPNFLGEIKNGKLSKLHGIIYSFLIMSVI